MNRESTAVLRAAEAKAYEHHELLPALREARRAAAPSIDLAILALFACCLVIGVVAAYDVYLSIKYQSLMLHQELNPLGLLLLKAEGGGVATFMSVKCFGTAASLFTIQAIFHFQRRLGLAVAGGVAGAQSMLGLYLLFG
jgi:hypothetical protein